MLAQVYLHRLTVDIQAKVYNFITVFSETIMLRGKYLVCNGTVETDLDVTQIDKNNGIDLTECLTLDKFFVSLQNNVATISSKTLLVENVIAAFVTSLATKISNCKIASEVVACLNESRVCLQVSVSANVAELSFCLLKQGVRLWMRKSAKS
ncbi:MAG: hypothetical protein NC099_02655 [Corallococcus sp.]|nr:hypothetical protein [Corallococcus sp.]